MFDTKKQMKGISLMFLISFFLFLLFFIPSALAITWTRPVYFNITSEVSNYSNYSNFSGIANDSNYWDLLDTPLDFIDAKFSDNITIGNASTTINGSRITTDEIFCDNIYANNICYSNGTGCMSINPFDQSLNTTDNATFDTVTANYFIGNGSQLTDINHSLNTYEEDINISVSSGSGTAITLTTFDYVIKQFIVTPITLSNTYNFEAKENASGLMIDRDRITHQGQWNILKYYALNNDKIFLNITNASIDETFTIKVRYIK